MVEIRVFTCVGPFSILLDSVSRRLNMGTEREKERKKKERKKKVQGRCAGLTFSGVE